MYSLVEILSFMMYFAATYACMCFKQPITFIIRESVIYRRKGKAQILKEKSSQKICLSFSK